jgi:hypothetical protein
MLGGVQVGELLAEPIDLLNSFPHAVFSLHTRGVASGGSMSRAAMTGDGASQAKSQNNVRWQQQDRRMAT